MASSKKSLLELEREYYAALKKNPAKRIGTDRPKRVSQADKKPPTKRLVTRRKKNTEPGYFPNPEGKRKHAEFPYYVQRKTASGGWTDSMGTKDKEAAFSFAKGFAKMHNVAHRVILREETEISE